MSLRSRATPWWKDCSSLDHHYGAARYSLICWYCGDHSHAGTIWARRPRLAGFISNILA